MGQSCFGRGGGGYCFQIVKSHCDHEATTTSFRESEPSVSKYVLLISAFLTLYRIFKFVYLSALLITDSSCIFMTFPQIFVHS